MINSVLSHADWFPAWYWLLAVAGAIAVPTALGWGGCRLFRTDLIRAAIRGPRPHAAQGHTVSERCLQYWLYGWLFIVLLSIPILCAYCVLADMSGYHSPAG